MSAHEGACLAVHDRLQALYSEGRDLDMECTNETYSIVSQKMRDWTNKVIAYLHQEGLSQADLFAFQNVNATENDSYQWGHKLRIAALRDIIARHSKELYDTKVTAEPQRRSENRKA